MATLAVACETDGVLGVVAPLALAAGAGTALVVDLDPAGPVYPGEGSLAELVAEGPRLDDLRPQRRGVAVLRNGGIDAAAAEEVIGALTDGWPNIVFRLSTASTPTVAPLVPVIALLPGGLTKPFPHPAVYQQVGWHEKAAGPGLTMPTPARSTVASLLRGKMPLRSS